MNPSEPLHWIDAQQERLIEQLLQLASVNSGTGNLKGLQTMEEEFADLFAPLADSAAVLPSTEARLADLEGNIQSLQYGNMLSFKKRPQAPVQVLLMGHMDTVFPADHHFQKPAMAEPNVMKGPGVADMKGGILVMLTALEAFEQTGDDRIGWHVLLNADEETGSHGSKQMIAESARQAHAGMIYEPALADGTLSRARKGSGNFALVARGKSAHAGREFEKGRNAIVALSQAIQDLSALTDLQRGLTVNIARVNGGTAYNVVPDTAVCQFNIRCHSKSDQREIADRLEQLLQQWNAGQSAEFELHGGFTRPPKEVTPAHQLLMDWTVQCGETLEIDVGFQDTGGCCDGNNMADAGLPNIDTLGVLGAHIHTDKEFMLVDSLAERAKLSFLLLQRLAAEGDRLIELKEAS